MRTSSSFHFLPKFLFLSLGGAIALVSLFSANRVFSQEEAPPMARQKLYFQKEILPDHLLYPVFAGFDRLRLELASPERGVELSVQYAWDRLKSTESLLANGYQELSFSTATKAFKYYAEALSRAQTLSLTEDQRAFLAKDNLRFQQEIMHLLPSFSDTQRHELQRLSTEQDVLRQFFIDSF